jgi:hypothetical protein
MTPVWPARYTETKHHTVGRFFEGLPPPILDS